MSRHHAGIVGTVRWARLRRRIFERDGWRCVRCRRPGRLECDHVRPLEDGGDPWNEANLQTLCRGCHIEKTRAERRRRRKAPGPLVRAWRELVADLNPSRGRR